MIHYSNMVRRKFTLQPVILVVLHKLFMGKYDIFFISVVSLF